MGEYLDIETEEIVDSMVYVLKEIELKEKELSSLREIYYKYKTYLSKLYPNDDVNVIEYLTKEKILKRGKEYAREELRKN